MQATSEFGTASAELTSLRVGLMAGALHLVLSAVCVLAFDVRITIDPIRGNWDYYWQTLPMDLLRAIARR